MLKNQCNKPVQISKTIIHCLKIKGHLNKWNAHRVHRLGDSLALSATHLRLIHRCDPTVTGIPGDFRVETDQVTLKSTWNCKGCIKAKTTLKKKE